MKGPRTSAADLTETVVIRKLTEGRDAYGNPITSWNTLASVRASVTPKSGEERALAGQLAESANYEVTMRYRGDINPADTALIWRGRSMNVRFVHDHGPRAAFLVLDAEIGTAEDAL
jgi:SPP1 family predicted phage head-tail adaptor